MWKILIIAGDMTLVSGDTTLGEMTLGRLDRNPPYGRWLLTRVELQEVFYEYKVGNI